MLITSTKPQRMVGAQDLEERMFTMESVVLAMSICNLDVEHKLSENECPRFEGSDGPTRGVGH